MSVLSIRHLEVLYNGNSILKDFSLEVEEGCIYSLIGPSGCGKSTLLKTICGIFPYQSGEINLNQESIDAKKHTLGYIPQYYGLLDWLTVSQNMSMGETLRKKSSSKKELIIKQLEMDSWLHQYPRELSGGQQQRTALARALMLEPQLLLMDEPFSSLDTFTAERSRDLFLGMWRTQKTTTLLVTHNLQEAIYLGKYVVLLSKQPASVLRIIENPLFNRASKPSPEEFYLFEQEVRSLMRQMWNTPV